MLSELKKIFFTEMHEIRLNGIAIVGWLSAALYAIVSLIVAVYR